MSLTISGAVGYIQPLGNGVSSTGFSQGRNGEEVVTELHGKYFESNRRGFVWSSSQALAGVLGTLVTATTVSNAIANPLGSGRGISLIRVEVAVKALPGTPVVGYYLLGLPVAVSGVAVTGTALTAQPGLVGSGLHPVANTFTTATLPVACVGTRMIQNKLTGAATTLPDMQIFALDFDGTCVLQPGTYATVGQDAADTTNATLNVCWVWEEVDL